MPETTTVERIAQWAAGLLPSAIPSDVVALARAQRRSVLAGIAASSKDPAMTRIAKAIASWAAPGPLPLLPTGARVRCEEALYAAAAGSIALDFDDYLCFAHSGHSAVLVPLLLAAETERPCEVQLCAQTLANEVEARLGGACLIGPQNGQLWSFVHAAGGALAAGRMLGLGAAELAHALALALYQPPRATVPGFMAPDSKLLTASEPLALGVRAARLAAHGVTGPLDVLDHPDGFLGAFAFAPLPGLLTGFGQSWASRTLSIKPYPGCAYVGTTVDALLELGPISPSDVDTITVEASMLTAQMNALSARYGQAEASPVTVNFSIPWNVAIATLAGRLTPTELHPRWLGEHKNELFALKERVVLRHDWDATRQAAEAFLSLLPPTALARDAGLAALARGLSRLRSQHTELGLGDAPLWRPLVDLVREAPRMLATAGSARLYSAEASRSFAMAFPARVRLRTRDGRERVTQARIPQGGAGHPERPPEMISREKLATYGPWLWGEAGTDALARGIDEDRPDLFALLGPAPGSGPG